MAAAFFLLRPHTLELFLSRPDRLEVFGGSLLVGKSLSSTDAFIHLVDFELVVFEKLRALELQSGSDQLVVHREPLPRTASAVSICTFVLVKRCQYLYFCTSKATAK